ncbi:pentatricopeptide repeat-containing protein At4g04790, mitochondrial isoform X2 [Neltuma alba]|nr:pentatricopeptide repeat-containing protein At4g04790, mitochondrial isoform X2 [Prosopis alba]
MSKAFRFFRLMREQGYELREQTYSPFLVYLIDMGMVEEFQLFCEVLKDENPSSVSRLGYYEMMLWLRVDNKEKIQDLCNSIAVNDGTDSSGLGENYLLAFCESDWKEGLLQLLEIVDITKLSSTESATSIFKSLGRLSLESYAEKFLSAFKTCDDEANNVTNFIASYTVSLPNLAVEDVILKFKDLHQKLEVSPSSSSYAKLIVYACDLLEVHSALKIVCEMCEAGLTLSTEVLNSILRSVEETCEYNLVHWIYSLISHYHLKPNCETFRCMINMCTRMKDFESAAKMLDDLEEMNLKPTSSMYNAIMAGYFREKNVDDALRVLECMKNAGVKPDSGTFNHLIGNSKTEEDITKYYEEMLSSCQPTKQTFVALVTAYAACGQLEKAKQVVLDPAIPPKSLNEIKCALLSTLASHGQLSDSIHIYEEIKESGNTLEPKAVISLIEGHIKSDGELDILFLLLKELTDPDYWVDGCSRIIMFCVENKHLSSAVDLIKQLNDKVQDNELLMEVLLDQVFSKIASSESTDLKFGLDLYWLIRKVLGIVPSRQCLDFLLTACANAKDLQNIRKIWKEYQLAGYPFNVLSYVRMYRALLVAEDYKSANFILKKIPKDDPDVRRVVKACQKTCNGRIALEKLTNNMNKKEKEEDLLD